MEDINNIIVNLNEVKKEKTIIIGDKRSTKKVQEFLKINPFYYLPIVKENQNIEDNDSDYIYYECKDEKRKYIEKLYNCLFLLDGPKFDNRFIDISYLKEIVDLSKNLSFYDFFDSFSNVSSLESVFELFRNGDNVSVYCNQKNRGFLASFLKLKNIDFKFDNDQIYNNLKDAKKIYLDEIKYNKDYITNFLVERKISIENENFIYMLYLNNNLLEFYRILNYLNHDQKNLRLIYITYFKNIENLDFNRPLKNILEEIESKYLKYALRIGKNKNSAAKLLGLNRTTFVEKYKRLVQES